MLNTLRWIIRIAGLGALLLGAILFADPGLFGDFNAALRIHMTLGGAVAVVLAIVAFLALFHRVRVPVAVIALAWAAATVYVGTVQDWWVGAGSHVIIEVIHPLLGIGAIGLAEMLGAAIGRSILKPASLA